MSSDSPNAPALELRNVTKFYGDFKAVDDISFRLTPGTICGFLGPNGAGKTTTIRMILDIIKPTQGSISILGEPSALKVRHRIGYLPEEKGLYKKMKAWSVIAYFATLKGLDRRTAKQRACELLERYGLKDFTNKPTDALSKGMQQKVQVLASIAHDPEFVILDEPFSGLDPVNQQVMEDIIRDMARRKRTVLFSTHVMQHAERLCECILLIAKGRKIFDGTIAEAKALFPKRVRIETPDNIDPLRNLGQILSIQPIVAANGKPATNGSAHWELSLRESADAQVLLSTCFEQKIRLLSFNQSEPTLHEIFMHLVGPEAKEAGFR
jgi:ABC-2 type transport system ATP-binding protein